MGGGNGQKSKMARERNMEKQKGAKGIFLSPHSFLLIKDSTPFFD